MQTISDLMHTGDEIPLASPDTPLKDALFTISAKRLGVTGVVDGDGRLVGIITDGDVRRAISKGVDLFVATAGTVMTPSPKGLAPLRRSWRIFEPPRWSAAGTPQPQ